MSSVPSSPEKPRKLLRWTDSSELEDVSRERPSTDDACEETGSNSTGPSKREDWYGVKMQRLKENVEQLRKDLQGKERDYIRLKNKYNVSKRRHVQLQEDLKKYADGKLDVDSELEFLRLQLQEKEKQISKHHLNGGHFENGDAACGHIGKNGGNFENDAVEAPGIDDVEENFFTEDSVLVKKYLALHKETRKLVTYLLLSFALLFGVITVVTRSGFLSTIVVGVSTLGISCLWVERKQLFKAFKLKYLKRIREISTESSRLRVEAAKLESRLRDLGRELANEKQEREALVAKFKAVSDKLADEMSKNEELVKLEKSTFEELQGERVRRRRAEEQLEEVSAQVLLAREKDEDAECGDVCQELRNNLKLERESKEKLSRENERLIKEIVEMNMKQEKERLANENNQQSGTSGQLSEMDKDQLTIEVTDKIDARDTERYLNYTNEATAEKKSQTQTQKPSPQTHKETQDNTAISNVEAEVFDPKECESKENHLLSSTGPLDDSKASQSFQDSIIRSQPQNSQDPSGNQSTATKDCWLCAWNIPNETSLVLLIIIVACLVLVLKVVLSNNGYTFAVVLAVVGGFMYYQVARNIEQSN